MSETRATYATAEQSKPQDAGPNAAYLTFLQAAAEIIGGPGASIDEIANDPARVGAFLVQQKTDAAWIRRAASEMKKLAHFAMQHERLAPDRERRNKEVRYYTDNLERIAARMGAPDAEPLDPEDDGYTSSASDRKDAQEMAAFAQADRDLSGGGPWEDC